MTGEARGLLPDPPRPVGGIRLVLMGGSMPGIERGVPGSCGGRGVGGGDVWNTQFTDIHDCYYQGSISPCYYGCII